MTALTFSPDPPHLLAGAGTADEQSARPRLYASSDGYGWSDTPPSTEGGFGDDAFGFWGNTPSTLAYYVLGPLGYMVDFGDGSPVQTIGMGGVLTTYAAAGTYTVTVTTDTGAPFASWDIVCSDDATSPNIVDGLPTHIPPGSPDTPVTVTGTNLVGSMVWVSTIWGESFQCPWSTVDASGGSFVVMAAQIAAGAVVGTLELTTRVPDNTQGNSSN